MPILSSVVSADKPCVGSFVYLIVFFFEAALPKYWINKLPTRVMHLVIVSRKAK